MQGIQVRLEEYYLEMYERCKQRFVEAKKPRSRVNGVDSLESLSNDLACMPNSLGLCKLFLEHYARKCHVDVIRLTKCTDNVNENYPRTFKRR